MQTLGAGPGMGLRPYQIDALKACVGEVESGSRRGVCAMPTGAGKTIVFANLPAALGLSERDRVLILAHRDELIEQARDKYLRVNPGEIVGIEKADARAGPMDRVVIASVQTLARENRRQDFFERWGRPRLVVTDECFPAGTLVDGRRIETLMPGDRIIAFDERSNRMVPSTVRRVFKKSRPTSLVRVSAGGHEIVCTANHPFWTRRGWVTAGMLRCGDDVARYDLHNVSGLDRNSDQEPKGHVASVSSDVLFQGVRAGSDYPQFLNYDGTHQSSVRIGQDETAQSHALVGGASSYGRDATADRAQTADQDGQRFRADAVRGATHGGIGSRLGPSYGHDAQKARFGVASPLQSGRRQSISNGGDRDRRRLAYGIGAQGARSQEDGFPSFVRVDGLTVFEPTSDGRFGDLCADGFVYNLEVDRYHTYVAAGFVVHNCHHAIAPTYVAIYDEIGISLGGEVVHVGFTATPKRGDNVGLDAVFDRVWYSISIKELIDLGHLSRLSGFRVETTSSLDGVRLVGKDFNQGDLSEVVDTPERNAKVVKSVKDLAPNGKVLVFAASVQHSKNLRDLFEAADFRCGHVDGMTMKLDDRRRSLAYFASDEYQVMTNVGVLTEGYDLPSIDTIVIARPTKSSLLYSQMIGRATRTFPGKERCTVIDVVDVSKRHSVVSLPTLLGLPPTWNLHGRDATKVAERYARLADESPLVAARIEDEETLRVIEALPPGQRAAAFLRQIIESYKAQHKYVPVELLRTPEMPKHVRSNFAWAPMGDGSYHLALSDARISVQPGHLGGFDIEIVDAETCRTETLHKTTEQDAIWSAENWARSFKSDQIGLVFKHANWRKEPVTDKQAWALKKSGITVPPGLTKGEASELLNQLRQLDRTSTRMNFG